MALLLSTGAGVSTVYGCFRTRALIASTLSAAMILPPAADADTAWSRFAGFVHEIAGDEVIVLYEIEPEITKRYLDRFGIDHVWEYEYFTPGVRLPNTKEAYLLQQVGKRIGDNYEVIYFSDLEEVVEMPVLGMRLFPAESMPIFAVRIGNVDHHDAPFRPRGMAFERSVSSSQVDPLILSVEQIERISLTLDLEEGEAIRHVSAFDLDSDSGEFALVEVECSVDDTAAAYAVRINGDTIERVPFIHYGDERQPYLLLHRFEERCGAIMNGSLTVIPRLNPGNQFLLCMLSDGVSEVFELQPDEQRHGSFLFRRVYYETFGP